LTAPVDPPTHTQCKTNTKMALTIETFPAQFMLYFTNRSSSKDPFSGFILMNATKSVLASSGLPYIRPTPATQSAVIFEFEQNPFNTIYYPHISKHIAFKGDADNDDDAIHYHRTRVWSTPLRRVDTGELIPVIEISKLNQRFVKMLKRNVALRVAVAAASSFISHVTAPAPAPAIPTPKLKKPKPIYSASKSTGSGDLCLHVARQLLELAQLKKEMCPIIAEEYTAGETAVMPCGHLFSKLAIQESFKKEVNKCPACRQLGCPTYI
jgi:hypothetical protein